jgi:hypothetical protein
LDDRATPDEMSRYSEQGFFVRQGVFTQRELDPLREAVEGVHRGVVAEAGRKRAEPVELVGDKRYQRLLASTVKWEWRANVVEIRSMEPYHHLDPRLDALIDDPRLWGPARAVVGSEELSLFSDKLNFKRPGGAPFPWHQDTPYWAFKCEHLDRLVSVLVYLDDATRHNGCLWTIPGSHRHGPLPCYQDRGVLGRLYTDVERFRGEEPVALDVAAGSVVYFHGDLIHGSQGNRSEQSRRALVLTYQPAGLPRWLHDDVRPVRQESRDQSGGATPGTDDSSWAV